MQWYDGLKRSKLNPPKLAFRIVWPILYALILASFILFAVNGGVTDNWEGTLYFFLQLALNIAWSYIFFSKHKLGLSFATIIALDVLVSLTIWKFWSTSILAASLLFPYLAWIGFATYLNWYVYANN